MRGTGEGGTEAGTERLAKEPDSHALRERGQPSGARNTILCAGRLWCV